MNYLLRRKTKYYFSRRVPEEFRDYDSRNVVRFTLKTSDYKTACRRAIIENDKLEAHWNTFVNTGQTSQAQDYINTANRAQTLGFSYINASRLAEMPIGEILKRLFHTEEVNFNKNHVDAVLGSVSEPAFMTSHALTRFFEFSKDKLLNKSPNQIRKWENPRKKAMENFINCIGDKPLQNLTREDVLKFRDWWIERVKTENLTSSSMNKDLIYTKTIIITVADNLKIKIDTDHIFRKLLINLDDEKRRLPFESEYIVSTLLNREKLSGLNEQAKWVLHAFAETGAGLNELTGLLAEDIFLDAEIPYIHIRAGKNRNLKTKFRNRTIPLVGYALDAFKACPQGFTHYNDRPDSLSGLLSKYLWENKLMPSKQHSVYSLRHSFQDRLLAMNTPDRIQADLMGHKFERPRYGDGATLAHKLEWMEKIRLKK